MPFDVSIISYEADVSWVEPKLIEIKDFLLHQKECPTHTSIGDGYSGCDIGWYLSAVNLATKTNIT